MCCSTSRRKFFRIFVIIITSQQNYYVTDIGRPISMKGTEEGNMQGFPGTWREAEEVNIALTLWAWISDCVKRSAPLFLLFSSVLCSVLVWNTCHSTARKSALWGVQEYQHFRLRRIHLKSCETSIALKQRLLSVTEGSQLPFICSVAFLCRDTMAVWIQ